MAANTTKNGIHAVSTLHGRRRPARKNYGFFGRNMGLRFRELYQFQFRRHRHPADSYHYATDIDAFLWNTRARSDEPRQDYSAY